MYIQPAYEQLSTAERVFVDQVVHTLDRNNDPISLGLERPLPQEVVDRSRGMLDRALVQAAIETRVRQIAAERELSPTGVLRELASIATSNIADFMRPEGEGMVWDFAGVTRRQWAAVKRIEIEGGDAEEMLMGGRKKPSKIKLEMHSKLDALKMAMQFMGLLAADNGVYRAPGQTPGGVPTGASAADASLEYQRVLEG